MERRGDVEYQGQDDSPRPRVSASPHLSLSASRVWAATLDLLFPPRCVGCRTRGAWLCRTCREQVQPVLPPICERCGQGIESGDLCRACRRRPLAIDGLRAAAYLEGPLRQAVHRFKYEGLRELVPMLGEILHEGYLQVTITCDVVVPVPLHQARQRQRGFNQATLLAQELSRRTGLPTASDLLRVRDTQPQVGLGAAARRDNVRDAFACRGRASLGGKRILLIDDVCTTGATMEACAAALYQTGVAAVWGLTLARERFAMDRD